MAADSSQFDPEDDDGVLLPCAPEPLPADYRYRLDKVTMRFLGTSLPLLALGLTLAYLMS